MRLCANENLPEECILRLRASGHDVLWIREARPGIPDTEVLTLAYAESRLLITFDKDFGDLVYRRGATASTGVILLRIPQPSAAAAADRISRILASRTDWAGHYSVVNDTSVRMRLLPQP